VTEDGRRKREGRGGGDEPPARLSRGTSGEAKPRNLRRGQAEEPPAYVRRRFDDRAEDSSVRRVEAPAVERARSSWCEIT